MAHAREEYLFQYSIYVLESCTSRRLTYFLPPTNLLPLLFVRPLRLFLSSGSVRRVRVQMLRAVMLPFVALIWFYEGSWRLVSHADRQRPLARIRARPLSTSNPSYGIMRSNGLGMVSALTKSNQPFKEEHRTDLGDAPGHSTQNAEVITLIQKLSAQVDELTAMVAAQSTN